MYDYNLSTSSCSTHTCMGNSFRSCSDRDSGRVPVSVMAVHTPDSSVNWGTAQGVHWDLQGCGSPEICVEKGLLMAVLMSTPFPQSESTVLVQTPCSWSELQPPLSLVLSPSGQLLHVSSSPLISSSSLLLVPPLISSAFPPLSPPISSPPISFSSLSSLSSYSPLISSSSSLLLVPPLISSFSSPLWFPPISSLPISSSSLSHLPFYSSLISSSSLLLVLPVIYSSPLMLPLIFSSLCPLLLTLPPISYPLIPYSSSLLLTPQTSSSPSSSPLLSHLSSSSLVSSSSSLLLSAPPNCSSHLLSPPDFLSPDLLFCSADCCSEFLSSGLLFFSSAKCSSDVARWTVEWWSHKFTIEHCTGQEFFHSGLWYEVCLAKINGINTSKKILPSHIFVFNCNLFQVVDCLKKLRFV